MNLRWRSGRSSYRPPAEPIRTEEYGVEVLDEGPAKAFVTEHHYSRSYPAARCRVGLFRRHQLVGVAVFSVPAQGKAIPAWLGVEALHGVELGRFVLLDDVPGNGETWFLARAFKLLRQEKPEVQGVLSYSDPLPRRSEEGAVVMPGHVGTIYQAFNATYLGRSRPGEVILGADGRPVSPRALSKIRNDEQGAGYAAEALVRAGAPRRQLLEDPGSWVRRALEQGPFRRLRHPGNHVYGWSFSKACTLPQGMAYPKKVEAA